MAMVWVQKQKLIFTKLTNNQLGQSAVEYILLLAVMAMIGATILNSQMFKDIFGGDSEIFKKFAKQMAYTYRHGVNGINDESDNATKHDSYFKGGKSRFFLPTSDYSDN